MKIKFLVTNTLKINKTLNPPVLQTIKKYKIFSKKKLSGILEEM